MSGAVLLEPPLFSAALTAKPKVLFALVDDMRKDELAYLRFKTTGPG